MVRHRDNSRPPLAQVMFNLRNAPVHGMHFDELTWRAHSIDLQAAHFEIALTIDMTISQAFVRRIQYGIVPREQHRPPRRSVHANTRVMVANLDVHIRDIPLLSPGEQDQMLHDWNATDCHLSGRHSLYSPVRGGESG